MKRFASIRFDRVLAPLERETTARTLSSAGVAATSWSDAKRRTYASARPAPGADISAAAALVRARIDVPALTVLRITPAVPARLDALARALGGEGRPAGVLSVERDDDSLIVELAAATPLATLVAVVDVELEYAPGRTIAPLLPLRDDVLAAFAGSVLQEPELDAGRIIETHLEPLLARAGAGA